MRGKNRPAASDERYPPLCKSILERPISQIFVRIIFKILNKKIVFDQVDDRQNDLSTRSKNTRFLVNQLYVF